MEDEEPSPGRNPGSPREDRGEGSKEGDVSKRQQQAAASNEHSKVVKSVASRFGKLSASSTTTGKRFQGLGVG